MPRMPIIIFTLYAETMTMKKEVMKDWNIAAVVRKDEATTTLLRTVRNLLHLEN
jgi:hypothetical protein